MDNYTPRLGEDQADFNAFSYTVAKWLNDNPLNVPQSVLLPGLEEPPCSKTGVLLTLTSTDQVVSVNAPVCVPGPSPDMNIDFLSFTLDGMVSPDFSQLEWLLGDLSGGTACRHPHYDQALQVSDGIRIAWLSPQAQARRRQAMHVHVSISGDGCRYLESLNSVSFSWPVFLSRARRLGARFSRLDIFKDTRSVDFRLDVAVAQFRFHRSTVASRYSVGKSIEEWDSEHDRGLTHYFGHARDKSQADTFVRMYDRRLALVRAGLPDPGYLVRVEMEMHNQVANRAVERVIKQAGLAWFPGLLRSRLDFKDPEDQDPNVSRRVTVSWWLSFINEHAVVRLQLAYRSKSLVSTVTWLRDAVAPTLARLEVQVGVYRLRILLTQMIAQQRHRVGAVALSGDLGNYVAGVIAAVG